MLFALPYVCDESLSAQPNQQHSTGRKKSPYPVGLLAVANRLATLCSRLPHAIDVHINCFRGSISSKQLQELHQHWLSTSSNATGPSLSLCRNLSTSAVTGMKGLFWKQILTPERTAAADIVWLCDGDMDIKAFNVMTLLEEMRASRALLAQPRIRAAWPRGRGTDIPNLQAHSDHFPSTCRAVETRYVETMTPIFVRKAWDIVHSHLLTKLPDELLGRTSKQLDDTWCGMLKRRWTGQPDSQPDSRRPACALLNSSVAHFDYHLIERAHPNVSLHRMNGSSNLVDQVDRSWRYQRSKFLDPGNIYAKRFRGEYVTFGLAMERGDCLAWTGSVSQR